MDYTEIFLPQTLVWVSAIVALSLLIYVVSQHSWRKSMQSGTLNVWFVSIFLLAMVWMIRASIDNGLNLHLSGTMLITLMFGWRLGVLGISLATVLVCLWGNILLVNLPLAILVYAVIAVTLCYLIFLIIEYFLPHNLYIYLYLSAFLGSALSFCFVGTLSASILTVFHLHEWETLVSSYLPFLYLMSFAEAFVTCGLLTLFVVYRPAWVFSFRDERYLKQK